MKKIATLRRTYERTIQRALADGFETKLLAAAFDNLEQGGPLRLNNFAYALRELLRHVLHRLAPTEDIRQCIWFKPDKMVKDGVTRAHRATYAIQGGLSDAFVKRKLNIDVRKIKSELISAIETLNKYTHIENDTFEVTEKHVYSLANECLAGARYFVDNIIECRQRVIDGLGEAIDHHILDEIISTTIDSLDELATHYYADEFDTEVVEVVIIGPKFLMLRVSGSIGVDLQYGSSSDVRDDMGMVTSESFPFEAELRVGLVRPLGKEASVEKFSVDTSSWYE